MYVYKDFYTLLQLKGFLIDHSVKKENIITIQHAPELMFAKWCLIYIEE